MPASPSEPALPDAALADAALADAGLALWTASPTSPHAVDWVSSNFERLTGLPAEWILGRSVEAGDDGEHDDRGAATWTVEAPAVGCTLRFTARTATDDRGRPRRCGTVTTSDLGTGPREDADGSGAPADEVVAETDASLVHRVLEACPIPISLTRTDGAVLYANAASHALFGELPKTRRGWAERFYADPEDGREYLRRLNRTGRVRRLELDVLDRNRNPLPAALSARLIEYGDEPVIVSVAEDLSEQRSLRDEMDRQREALAQSEKLSALGELLASVAHELNNPLSVVVGQALLLGETASDDRTRQRAERIGGAAERCARIVRSFLSMARPQPAATRRFDVCDSVRAAAEMTASSLRDSGVELHLRLPDDLPRVDGDQDQLTQVLTNLILNARHALAEVQGPRHLKITASARTPGGTVVIKVKDNGPGVPAEHRRRIFEPLFTTRAAGTGTGMGLALSHRIIEAHGGTLHLERARRGASFSVRLPRAAEVAVDGLVRSETVGSPGAALDVLIIDDEPEVADTLAEMVRADGHAVSVAHSGLEALDVLGTRGFDVVLSDVKMPGLDGPGLFDALGERGDAVMDRLVFITGDSLTPHVQRFLARCGRPCMEKPVQPAEVRAILRAFTGRSK